jgi:TRAP-type C4-dicarboxylate transport system substrate-binding protein
VNPNRRRVAVRVATAITVLTLAVACQTTQGADKTGGETAVLTLATFEKGPNENGQNYGPAAFVENLGKVSGGRLRVELKPEFGGGGADAESNVVRAIAAGEVDGGWPSTRAFANGGISGLEAVEAPLTITTYAAEKALVSGPVATELLGRLDGKGVVGLGLTVGPLRRPFAASAPLLGPEDWEGVSFRVFNSPVQADAVRALGGDPADLSFSFVDQLKAGNLRGAEFDIAQYDHNGFSSEAGNVTANVVLWPKVFVLALSQKRFDSLTDQQRTWVRDAAKQAVDASVTATYDESPIAQSLCGKGVRFLDASPAQVQGLRSRLRPVLDKLAADPAGAKLLSDLQAIGAQSPGPEKPEVPANCAQGTAAGKGSSEPVPAAVSKLPDGIYRTRVTTGDVVAAVGSEADGAVGIWTIKVRRGTYETSCRPIDDPGRDCGDATVEQTGAPLEVGDLRGTGGSLYFVPSAERLSRLTGCKLPPSGTLPDHCGPDDPYRISWAVSGDRLTFGPDDKAPELLVLWVNPWRKIA